MASLQKWMKPELKTSSLSIMYISILFGRKWVSKNNFKLIVLCLKIWVSPIAQLVKNLPAIQETLVRFLGQEDPLEKGWEGWATHSSILGLPLWLSW